jgi:hypothetical protein
MLFACGYNGKDACTFTENRKGKPMKKLAAPIFLLLLLLAVWPSNAQEPPTDWEIVILDQDTPGLLIIGANGSVEEIDLGGLPSIDLRDVYSMEVNISSSGNRLVAYLRGQGYVIDLQPDVACCIEVPPFTEEEEAVSGMALDAEGKRLALGTVYTEGSRIVGKITVYDLETLTVLNTLASGAWNFDDEPAAIRLEWLPNNQIRFLPSCWSCEGDSRGFYWEWNPETSELVKTPFLWSIFGESLINTDHITTTWVKDYPFSGLVGFSGFLPNAVAYYADPRGIMDDDEIGRTLVFFDPDFTSVEAPNWILDGQAFVVSMSTGDFTDSRRYQHVLVHRDGTQLEIETGSAIGTPDGWVALGEDRMLWHYTYTPEDGIQRQELTQLPRHFAILKQPVLGSSITQQSFAAISPYDWGEPVCEGALPTRLNVGGEGIVIPPPNNLRAEPNAESEKLGEIPGGENFIVVGGPECTPGMTWWQVEYDGITGWTAEGGDGTYWVEHGGQQSFQ